MASALFCRVYFISMLLHCELNFESKYKLSAHRQLANLLCFHKYEASITTNARILNYLPENTLQGGMVVGLQRVYYLTPEKNANQIKARTEFTISCIC